MNFWGVGSVGNVGSVGKSMIFQHSQCFQCFQCSKKRGTPLKIPPHCERSSHQTQRRWSAQTPRGRNSTARATAQRRWSAQAPQGRHSTARATAQCRKAHKLRRTARTTTQERRNEDGRLSEVAALAVTLLALELGNHSVVHGMKIQVCLLLLLT